MTLSVDSNGILQPLGLAWLRDNRFEVIGSFKKYTEEIAGRDGAISFGADRKPKMLKAVLGGPVSGVQSDDNYRAKVLDSIAVYLDPLAGEQSLTFWDEPGRVYYVTLDDVINIPRERGYLEFEVSFTMLKPAKISANQNSLTGSGTATNAGNEPTPFTLTISGPVTNPTVTVAGYTMTYTGEIAAGKALVVDTEKMTAIYDGANALPNLTNVFPLLQPGANTVVAASGGTTVLNWYDRWK